MADEKKYKIVHDRDTCIGCAACASVCPNYWSMADDGKSDVKGGVKTGNGGEEVVENLTEEFDSNVEAAESCPVNCIHVLETKEDGTEEKII